MTLAPLRVLLMWDTASAERTPWIIKVVVITALTVILSAVIGMLLLMELFRPELPPTPTGTVVSPAISTTTAWTRAQPTITLAPPTITTKGLCGLLGVAEVEAVLGPNTGSQESPVGCRWGEFPRDVAVIVVRHVNPEDAAVEFKTQMLGFDGHEAPGDADVGNRSFYYTHHGRDGNIVWLQGSHVCSVWVNLPDHHTGNRPAALVVAQLVSPRIPK